MIKIGITGGIGSGKTTVSHFFEKEGIPVYYADEKAKELMRVHKGLKQSIIRLFGAQSYEDNKLNTRYISGIVFDDKEKLLALEQLVHPVVREDFLKWVDNQNQPIVAVENAILHHSGMDQLVDYVVTVTADKDKRVKRVVKRDNFNKEEVLKRMNNQINTKKMLNLSDFVIYNNGSLNKLEKEVGDFLQKVKIMLKKG